MITLDFQSVSEVLTSRAINTVLEGLTLAGLSWGVLRCFGARSSMTRFAVWFSTLLVIAGLPFMQPSSSGVFTATSRLPQWSLSSAWAWYIFVAWAGICIAMLLRLGWSLLHVYRLRRRCRRLDISSHSALASIALYYSSTRKIDFLVSDEVRIPTALGFFHPAVVLPSWVLAELSADELKVIVLHELAHLRRWDDWTNLAQKFLKAVFFFHPAVWWIDGRLALEREIACDDLVLEQSANAHTYAASLVTVAEKVAASKMRTGRVFAVAQSALGRMREVSFRISRILAPGPRRNRSWRPALAMIGSMAVVTATAMPYAPELISFHSKGQPALSAESGTASESIAMIPAKWITGPAHTSRVKNDGAVPKRTRRMRAAERMTETSSGEEVASRDSRFGPRALVIPAKTTQPRKNSARKMVWTKAAERTQLSKTLLVLRSTATDNSGAIWMFSVWRCIGPNGEQQTVQEIVMSSI
jgi:bla regulator protein blaR1